MNPKKHLIERARENGAIDRMNQLLSAAHILASELNNIVDESADIMREHGLLLGELKKLHKDFIFKADRLFTEFSKCVLSQQKTMEYFEDLDEFHELFMKWAQIPLRFEPKTKESSHEA